MKRSNFQKQDIYDYFDSHPISEERRTYLEFHADRYVYLLDLMNKNIETVKKMLDVGPSLQTNLFRHFFPSVQVDTLGFNRNSNNLRSHETHHTKDFNLTYEKPECDIRTRYDLIICAEVIEHLYTNPVYLLKFLNQLLTKQGIIIIQTPNGVAWHRRFEMLRGNNPFPEIQEDRMGHFREYTGIELNKMFKQAGYQNIKLVYKNYFGLESVYYQVMAKKFNRIMPKSLRDGITVTASK